MTEDSGYYLLLMYVRKGKEIRVGKRAPERFARGWHVYAGSAQRGLSKRIARHQSAEKKLHWHIDYLLEAAELKTVIPIPDPLQELRRSEDGGAGEEKLPFECRLARGLAGLPGAAAGPARFGAGDCTCPGHLTWFRANPEKTLREFCSIFAG